KSGGQRHNWHFTRLASNSLSAPRKQRVVCGGGTTSEPGPCLRKEEVGARKNLIYDFFGILYLLPPFFCFLFVFFLFLETRLWMLGQLGDNHHPLNRGYSPSHSSRYDDSAAG